MSRERPAPGVIIPEWPAPAGIRAAQTTREGGLSLAPYASLNLATHVGDDADTVRANRRLLREALNLPAEPLWLEQVHGVGVHHARAGDGTTTPPRADAAYSDEHDVVLAVLTADCLPVLFASRDGDEIGAAHAGWRGLLGGVLEAALANFRAAPGDILAWFGPAIGPAAFEVGDEVREAFVQRAPEARDAFAPTRPGHWRADLYALARQRLAALGLSAVYGGELCSFSDPARFYAYRREAVTGRMASLIWKTRAA